MLKKIAKKKTTASSVDEYLIYNCGRENMGVSAARGHDVWKSVGLGALQGFKNGGTFKNNIKSEALQKSF